MDRCRLLAEAIVRIHERADAGASDRLAVIEEAFAEDGISLEASGAAGHLPGSAG